MLFAPEAADDGLPDFDLFLPGRYSSRDCLPDFSRFGECPLDALGPRGARGDGW
jgi:hypothetical protein